MVYQGPVGTPGIWPQMLVGVDSGLSRSHESPAVPGLTLIANEALLWLPALFVIVSHNALFVALRRPMGRLRWFGFVYIASAPACFPAHGSYSVQELGVFNTLLTSAAIVGAARLPDWDQAVSRSKVTRATLFAWMSLPVVSLTPCRLTAKERYLAGILALFRALAKRLAWMLCAWSASSLDQIPWLLKSALLILYFVLNLTAFHDLVVGLVHFAGLGVDELFDAPLLSSSPRDFWSRRWNKFINRFALKNVALKVRHRLSPFGTIFLVFFVSGLFHEYFSWGVDGFSRAPGSMTLFFSLQALAIWFGSRWPLRAPRYVTQPLTFCWMALTAPLFFIEVAPALLDFTYPEEWFPFAAKDFWGWVHGFPPTLTIIEQ